MPDARHRERDATGERSVSLAKMAVLHRTSCVLPYLPLLRGLTRDAPTVKRHPLDLGPGENLPISNHRLWHSRFGACPVESP